MYVGSRPVEQICIWTCLILLNEKVWLTLRAFNCEADNDLNDEDGSVQILRVGPRSGGQ